MYLALLGSSYTGPTYTTRTEWMISKMLGPWETTTSHGRFMLNPQTARRNPFIHIRMCCQNLQHHHNRLGRHHGRHPCGAAEPQVVPIRNLESVRPSAVKPWLPLSLVCRNWHNAAISTPSLWAVIIIPPWSRSPFYRVAKQLGQRKDAPIDIRIHTMEDSWIHTSSCIPQICILLLAHVHRWRSLEARVHSAAMHMHEILDTFSNTRVQIAPQLTSIVLVCRGCQCMSSLPSGSFGFSVPHLNTIRPIEVAVDWNQPWISSAFNLTTPDIRGHRTYIWPSWTQFCTILNGAPRLKALILEAKPRPRRSLTWVDPDLEDASEEYTMNPVELFEPRQLVINLPTAMAIYLPRRGYIPDLRKLILCGPGQSDDIKPLVAQLIAPRHIAGISSVLNQLPGTQERSRSLLAGVDYLCLDRFWCSTPSMESLYGNHSLTSLVL